MSLMENMTGRIKPHPRRPGVNYWDTPGIDWGYGVAAWPIVTEERGEHVLVREPGSRTWVGRGSGAQYFPGAFTIHKRLGAPDCSGYARYRTEWRKEYSNKTFQAVRREALAKMGELGGAV